MILEKRFNLQKYRELKQLFHDVTFSMSNENGKTTFETEDSKLLNFVEKNFDDYVETELRLDALEAHVVGERSTLDVIKSKLGLS